MISTKDIYMKACLNSKELHPITDEEKDKLQMRLKQMYLDLEAVCNKHGLLVMAGYGTVLGAVRHQGFIPWDDDFDVMMPRDDYEKLINLYSDELPSQYRIFAPNSKHDVSCRFATFVDVSTRYIKPGADINNERNGVYIDIFPIDNALPRGISLKWRNFYTRVLLDIGGSVQQYEEYGKFFKLLMCASTAGKVNYYLRNTLGFLCSFWNKKQWFDHNDKYFNLRKDTGYYNIPMDGGLVKSLVPQPKEMFFPPKKMKFDEIEVFVPNKAIEYLEHNYGDWKWMPPADQRWQHFIQALILDYKKTE